MNLIDNLPAFGWRVLEEGCSQATLFQFANAHRNFLHWPDVSTSISRALAGRSEMVAFPAGQRTHIFVGCSGVASTCTALSCDQ